uniref:SDR family oxidoreductase n=1 Tax=Roseihalotalea indica TaxID=2867963 RepID=A0AA49GS76_9BACT|nr:SDR family oxidoreductase [Tunicatimonas sp. TK19036]
MKLNNRKPETSLRGKVVVITGASAGVGRATVREFAKYGTKIGLLARGKEGLNGAQKDAEALGSQALAIPTDVADALQVEEAAQRIEQELGPIDIWVNNAMNSVFSPFKEVTPEEFKRVTEVTYLGQVYGTMAALKRMLPCNQGSIVLVGSALAYRGIPLQSAYCGAKHGIEGFYDSLRAELMHDKSEVKVTMVQLPALNTTQFSWVKSRLPNKARPMGTIFQPEVAAQAIVFAATNDRREVFVGYPTVQTILGNKIAPWFADWVLARNGYKGQQTDEPLPPNRQDNLWEPVPGDHGAHGEFNQQAHNFSWQLWATENRDSLVIGALTAAATWLGISWFRSR